MTTQTGFAGAGLAFQPDIFGIYGIYYSLYEITSEISYIANLNEIQILYLRRMYTLLNSLQAILYEVLYTLQVTATIQSYLLAVAYVIIVLFILVGIARMIWYHIIHVSL